MAGGEDRRVLRELAEAVAAGIPVVLATVVATRRSVPRRAGAKMLVFGDGRLVGSVGGGAMESRVIDAALEELRAGTTKLLEYELVDPARGDPGLCGGEVHIYLEPYMPPPTVLVVGAGHVGRAVIDLAHWLGYRTVIADDREELLTPSDLPKADVFLKGVLTESLAGYEITAETSVVVVSRDVEIDVEAVSAFIDSPAGYVGVMGSSRRWKAVRDRLVEGGIEAEALGRVHAPIGIELGAETVEEIAVSILSEVIRVRRGAEASRAD
jgi:xanthine dehydrogenase accessory factor